MVLQTRKTGKKIEVEETVCERFCDVCSKIMPDRQYPQFELEVTYKEYKYDGDQPARFDICSLQCVIEKAKSLLKNNE